MMIISMIVVIVLMIIVAIIEVMFLLVRSRHESIQRKLLIIPNNSVYDVTKISVISLLVLS